MGMGPPREPSGCAAGRCVNPKVLPWAKAALRSPRAGPAALPSGWKKTRWRWNTGWLDGVGYSAFGLGVILKNNGYNEGLLTEGKNALDKAVSTGIKDAPLFPNQDLADYTYMTMTWLSITGNSTNPTRFQHPVAGTYKKERMLAGKPYFSVASGGGTGRTLHPDNMAAGPASYGMTDTMGRMHSDAQFAGSSSVPAHVEMMGFLGIGNNPMVGCTCLLYTSSAFGWKIRFRSWSLVEVEGPGL